MTESQFIDKNESSWKALEELLKQEKRDADKLNELFIKVSSDLSFAKTYFPNRMVRLYLNNLTQRVFDTMIVKQKKFGWKNISDFFVHVLPQEIYRARKALLTSLLIFVTALSIGVVSSKHYEGFPALILGESYVSMTEENIEKGDPMAVYKDQDKFGMFFGITSNNVRVAFLAFVLGILGSLGTILVLVSNGIMVGAFQYFFYAKGVFWISFLTIWIHGTIEISCIIIAGGAGIVLGNGLLFPRTYNRSSSLQVSALRALRIILGTVPLFVIAGFLESYVTRQTELPVAIKVTLILLSAILIIMMWIVYPWYYHKYKAGEALDYELAPKHEETLVVKKLERKTLSKVFSDSFIQFRQLIGNTITNITGPCLLVLSFSLFLFLQTDVFDEDMLMDIYNPSYDLSKYTIGGMHMFLLYTFLIGFLLTSIAGLLEYPESKLQQKLIFFKSYFFKIVIAGLILYLPYTLLPSSSYLIIWLVVSPHFVVILIEKLINNSIHNLSDVYNTFLESFKGWHKYLTYYVALYAIYLIAQLLKTSMVSSVIVELISWHKLFDNYTSNSAFTNNILDWTLITLFVPLAYYLFRNQYYSIHTEEHATDLKVRLKSFGSLSPAFEK